jgi:hypothetical protein
MRPCWQPGSSPLRSTPGRTRTCVRLHVREVPLPLGHGGSNSVGPAGVEPAPNRVSDGRLPPRLRPECRAPGGSRTRLSTLAKWCLDRSATGASRTSTARAEGVEPSACGLEPQCSPRSTPLWKPKRAESARDAGRSRTCLISRVAADRLAVRPRRPHSARAGGGTRTHLVRVTKAVPGPSSIAGTLQQPVLVSSQLDRGSEPQSPPEGLATSRSCRSRTLPTRFRRPSARSRETTHSTPCQSRTGQPAFGRPVLGAARQGLDRSQGVRGELNPPPRPSQGRMLACYTTNTIVTRPCNSDQGGT